MADLFSSITFTAPSTGAIVSIILAGALLYVSGFISASEIAFFSLSPSDLSKIDEERSAADKKIKYLLDNSERLLATILISNNFVNVTIIMLCNYFFASCINFGESLIVEFIVITIILTFLLLLFGEIIPKIYSSQNTLKFSRKAAGAIMVLNKIFSPFSSLLVRSSFFVNRFISKRNYNISVDDLSQALELTDRSEISEESDILEGIIRFGAETVKEVMTPRPDMVNLDITASYPEVIKSIVENSYSRIPVYEDSRDNIKGILYIKDLLPYLDKDDSFKWQSLIRPAFFVPETKMIDDLLRDFQANKIHIAIVVDEFGGTSGLITMEDIIEEIVGEINDEYDEEETNFIKTGENTYIFKGKTLLTDFFRALDIDEELFDPIIGEADTLAGLLLEMKGEFPSIHEKFDYENYNFEVLEMTERRILKVKVTITPKDATD